MSFLTDDPQGFGLSAFHSTADGMRSAFQITLKRLHMLTKVTGGAFIAFIDAILI